MAIMPDAPASLGFGQTALAPVPVDNFSRHPPADGSDSGTGVAVDGVVPAQMNGADEDDEGEG